MPDHAPYRNFNFRVEIDGLPETGFSEVVVPETRIEVVEYREGGDHTSGTRKLPGRAKVGNVVLRRGIDQDLSLWNWFRAVRDGDLDRRNVSDHPPRRDARGGSSLGGAAGLAHRLRLRAAPGSRQRGRDRDARARVRASRRGHLTGTPPDRRDNCLSVARVSSAEWAVKDSNLRPWD